MTDTDTRSSGAHAYGRFPQPSELDHHGRPWEPDWHQVAGRLLTHLDENTTDSLDGTMIVPVEHYLDPRRWEREVDLLFRRKPVISAMSAHLPDPGSYRAIDIAGVPVLTVRQADGSVRAFINACRHRGALVVGEGCGHARRFTCPYHAWSYDNAGALVGISGRDKFGDVDTDSRGLTELPCDERSGLVFVVLQPDGDRDLDLDDWLGGYDAALDQLGLADMELLDERILIGPNWKIAFDGYVDGYHLDILHRDTLGVDVMGNVMTWDAWGPHQRVSSPDPRMVALDEIPEDDWSIDHLTAGVWTIFPHTSIAAFKVEAEGVDGGGRMYMVSTLFPGDDPDTSVTIQNFLAAFEPTDALLPVIEAQQRFLLHVVRDEDYATGNRIQRSVKSGA